MLHAPCVNKKIRAQEGRLPHTVAPTNWSPTLLLPPNEPHTVAPTKWSPTPLLPPNGAPHRCSHQMEPHTVAPTKWSPTPLLPPNEAPPGKERSCTHRDLIRVLCLGLAITVYIYNVYDLIFGDFPDKNTVYTPYI